MMAFWGILAAVPYLRLDGGNNFPEVLLRLKAD
jgi:hypothetical protein